MQPIWNEQITMWRDFGIDIPIEEGSYWINNQVVKAYDSKTGKLCNLYRINVHDDLSISCKPHKDLIKHTNCVFETWEQTANRNIERLSKLESNSVSFMIDAMRRYPDYEHIVLTSTGKDSSVTEHIARKSGFLNNGRCVFNNTTCDVADTYRMVKRHGYEITNPDEGFYQYIKRMRFIPTRFGRGCCTIFKEGNFKEAFAGRDKLLVASGVRNAESPNRAAYEDYEHNPKYPDNWISVLPIRKWSDEDIWLYIIRENIEVNKKYKMGYQRVGCAIACPYYTKSTWALDKYWYPKMFFRWHQILDEDFVEGERWTKLNCTKAEYHKCWNGGVLRPEPTEEVIQEFMTHKGFSDYKLAMQYFNKACKVCGKNVRQPEVVAMNLKMYGRQTNRFLCKKHMREELGWTEADWDSRVEDFKAQECKLF